MYSRAAACEQKFLKCKAEHTDGTLIMNGLKRLPFPGIYDEKWEGAGSEETRGSFIVFLPDVLTTLSLTSILPLC